MRHAPAGDWAGFALSGRESRLAIMASHHDRKGVADNIACTSVRTASGQTAIATAIMARRRSWASIGITQAARLGKMAGRTGNNRCIIWSYTMYLTDHGSIRCPELRHELGSHDCCTHPVTGSTRAFGGAVVSPRALLNRQSDARKP
jgi:hypothetical protein